MLRRSFGCSFIPSFTVVIVASIASAAFAADTASEPGKLVAAAQVSCSSQASHSSADHTGTASVRQHLLGQVIGRHKREWPGWRACHQQVLHRSHLRRLAPLLVA